MGSVYNKIFDLRVGLNVRAIFIRDKSIFIRDKLGLVYIIQNL